MLNRRVKAIKRWVSTINSMCFFFILSYRLKCIIIYSTKWVISQSDLFCVLMHTIYPLATKPGSEWQLHVTCVWTNVKNTIAMPTQLTVVQTLPLTFSKLMSLLLRLIPWSLTEKKEPLLNFHLYSSYGIN